MNESDLRKWHRSLGILLALFIILQAGSGLLITLKNLSVPHSHAHEGAPGNLKSEEAEKPVLLETYPSEVAPGLVENFGTEEPTQHESYAHGQPSGHVESHEAEKPGRVKYIEAIHHGGGAIGTVYRLLVGIGMLGMAISGSMIFFRIQARAKKG